MKATTTQRLLALFCLLLMAPVAGSCKRSSDGGVVDPLPPALNEHPGAAPDPNTGREQIVIEADLGSAEFLEAKVCSAAGCVVHTLTDDAEAVVAGKDVTGVDARACVAQETGEHNCSAWTTGIIPPQGSASDDDHELELIVGLSVGGTAAVGATFLVVTRVSNYTTIKADQARGDFITEELQEKVSRVGVDKALSVESTAQGGQAGPQQRFVFGYDLDETLTDVAYKGKARAEAQVHLKDGLLDTLQTHLRNGDGVVVVTANVRADVETFLMTQLGLDPRQASDVLLFRDHIMVKQPDLPEAAHFAEPLKPSKGAMFAEAVTALQTNSKDGRVIAGAFFSDDKTGFLKSVLHDARLTVPVVGLRVGDRPHSYQDPIDALMQHGTYKVRNAGPLNSSGSSTEFARLTKHLSHHRSLGLALLAHARLDQGGPYILSDANARKLATLFQAPALRANAMVLPTFATGLPAPRFAPSQIRFGEQLKPASFTVRQARTWQFNELRGGAGIEIQKPAALPIKLRP